MSKLRPLEEMELRNVQKPPAKIASPKIGKDVAVMPSPGELRDAVLHFPEVALKMSTALDVLVPSTAKIMRSERRSNATDFIHSTHATPSERIAVRDHRGTGEQHQI